MVYSIWGHEETVIQGDARGLFFGLSKDHFKFYDQGRSEEKAWSGQLGYHWAKAHDGYNKEHVFSLKTGVEYSKRHIDRHYWVVDKMYDAQADYYSMGAFLDMKYAWEKRYTPALRVTPSIGLDLAVRYLPHFEEEAGVRKH